MACGQQKVKGGTTTQVCVWLLHRPSEAQGINTLGQCVKNRFGIASAERIGLAKGRTG